MPVLSAGILNQKVILIIMLSAPDVDPKKFPSLIVSGPPMDTGLLKKSYWIHVRSSNNYEGREDMQIKCHSCCQSNEFILGLWARTTFRFNEDDTLTIIHLTQLESLEDKLSDNISRREIQCKECGSNEVEIIFNEYDNQDEDEVSALEGL